MLDADRLTRVDVRLRRAIESGAMPKELLVCGPAGTGKTFSILAVLHLLSTSYPNLRILICRQTRVALSESALATYEQEILPLAGMESIAAGASRRHRSGYVYPNGTEWICGGLDNPGRIASTSFDVIYLNEAIEAELDGWETLGSRLDRPGRPRALGWLIGDTNPGPPSHHLKKRCDDGRAVLWDVPHQANPAMFDGRRWTPAGRNYLARLDRLRGTRRARLRDGQWAAGEGVFFEGFDARTHVSESAELDRRLPVHLAVDSGVHCAAVWFQVRGAGDDARVNVFGDYYQFNRPAYDNAKAILARGRELGCARIDKGSQDPAGDQNSPTGVIVTGEFHRAGLRLENWPSYPGSRSDGLTLVESFVSTDPPALTVHPRCRATVEGFANYRRAMKSGQYTDLPVERQHPFEDVMDALRGGLTFEFNEGRRPKPKFSYTRPGRLI